MDARFICRREGHLPQLNITQANGVDGAIITRCQRCGSLIEYEWYHSAVPNWLEISPRAVADYKIDHMYADLDTPRRAALREVKEGN